VKFGTRTVLGRVVYDRKKHYFTNKDIQRISRRFLDNPDLRLRDLLDYWVDQRKRDLLLLERLITQLWSSPESWDEYADDRLKHGLSDLIEGTKQRFYMLRLLLQYRTERD
jgi:hypothetical protein